MSYITRDAENWILNKLDEEKVFGLILSGIVGSGKTTLIENVILQLNTSWQCFSFTCDDVQLRLKVAQDTKYLLQEIRSTTQKKCLVFVDEVQKSEEIFDSLKILFDAGISFIVTGSNPAYLNSIARKRLQRRADWLTLYPFYPSELLVHQGNISSEASKWFAQNIFFQFMKNEIMQIPAWDITLSADIKYQLDTFLSVGGLPLAFLKGSGSGLSEVRKSVERGFEALEVAGDNLSEIIEVELAQMNAQEFTYKNIFKKTGLRRREIVNKVIANLIDHGYLLDKRPFTKEGFRSYLVVYSFIDPGIVNYLCGDIADDLGHHIESCVHARLNYLKQFLSYKCELYYFKPYQVDAAEKSLRFGPGEIDFIFKAGKSLLPIECKRSAQINNIDTSQLETFIKKNKLAFGVIAYGGVPYFDAVKKIYYWPWWML
jgi:predicted AAA+ superfamily ATPase